MNSKGNQTSKRNENIIQDLVFPLMVVLPLVFLSLFAATLKTFWRSTEHADIRKHSLLFQTSNRNRKWFDNRFQDLWIISRLRNSELETEVLKLKQEILDMQGVIAAGSAQSANGSLSSDRITALEQKIYKLQEELTELHRSKGEHAQKLIDLNKELKLKDDKMSLKEALLLDSVNNMEAMSTEAKNLQTSMIETETAMQVLKDEHQALQMAYNSLEQRLRKTQEENRQLVGKLLNEKARDADRLNSENELMERNRQEKLQKELSEAVKEPVSIGPRPNGSILGDEVDLPPPGCCVTSIPDRPRAVVEAHDGEVSAVRFSISGKNFVTGGSDRKIKIWETGRGSCSNLSTLHGCSASVMCVRFDPQERMILAASNDKACRIWTIGDQRIRHTLTGHTDKVLSAKFLGSDSSKIVSGSNDRTLKIWDLRSKACTKTIFAGSSCNDLVTSDLSGRTIISGHFDKRVRFWDVRSDAYSNEIQLQGKVTSLDLSQDMNYLLACTRDDALKLIDLRRNQIMSTFRSDGFRVAFDWTRACFSPDAQYLACGSHDGGVYVWDSKTCKVEKVLKEHKCPVIACAWHPVGNYILTSDRNKHVILWSDI